VDDKRAPRIEVFYVKPGGEYTRDDKLFDKVNKGLKLNHEISTSTFHTDDLDENDDLDKNGLKLKISTSELVFAVVDDRGHDKDDTQKSVAQLHKFAALEAGVPIVCVTWKHLDKLYTRRLDASPDYLSATLQAKINYMLGGTNFDTELKRLTTGNNLMIAGAHIAHYIGDRLCCSYITAVVASKDDTTSHFLGSARIQTTTYPIEGEKPQRGCESRLIYLRDMVVKRFKN
jgi:hypothetical protein